MRQDMPQELFTHFSVRLQIQIDQVKREGLHQTIVRLFVNAATFLGWLLLLPASISLHLAGFRRLSVITGRIGHFAAEIDCFLKAKALGEVPRRSWFILAPPNQVANQHLLRYWQKHIAVVFNPVLAWLLSIMSRWLFVKYDVGHYVLRLNKSQDIYRLNARWRDRPPILKLNSGDEAWGAAQLRDLGLPDRGWFVCIHVREAGFSLLDDTAHEHRNGSIEAIVPAMGEIVARGGWCVRMGDPSMTALPPMEGVIDYAHHPLKSERMDVFLCARARFFLGNTSGLAFLSLAFGVRSALANMIPTSALGVSPEDLSIPKLLWFESESRFLRFDEIMASPVANYRYAKLYSDAGIQPVENSAEDIAALVVEMLERKEGRFEESEQDSNLQRRFQSLLRPDHYSYGTTSKIATSFLRKYQYLLPATA